MGFYDAFFGSDQSLYTAYSIIAAIIAICLTILLTATDIPIGNRILIVLFVIITLIPSIFLTLFELTCIVTGGTEPNRWWCHAFAWILAAFIIIYCIIVIIVSLVSLFNYNKAIYTVNSDETKYKLTNNDSDNYAKDMINADEIYTKKVEQFNNYKEKFEASGGGITIFDGIGALREQALNNANYPSSAEQQIVNSPSNEEENKSQSNFIDYSKYPEKFENQSLPSLSSVPSPPTPNTNQLSTPSRPQKPISSSPVTSPQITSPHATSSANGSNNEPVNNNNTKMQFSNFSDNLTDNIVDDRYAAYQSNFNI
jgi:hypothetical protein